MSLLTIFRSIWNIKPSLPLIIACEIVLMLSVPVLTVAQDDVEAEHALLSASKCDVTRAEANFGNDRGSRSWAAYEGEM
jgi:hypothetical protein